MHKILTYSLLILILGFLAGCKPKLKNSEDKLVEMIADFHIAKAALQRFPPQERDSIYQVFSDEIFEIHEVTKSSFDFDILQLEKDPVLYQGIMDKVTGKLNGGESKEASQ